MNNVERFLSDVARDARVRERKTLRIIGSTALILRTNYVRGTKDSDVLETPEIDAETKAHLIELAGKGSKLARRNGIYLEFVSNGIPFLPHPPRWHPVGLGGAPTMLAFEALDVVDVVVSKIKRFNAADRSDIADMIARDLVPHRLLIERFESAVDEAQCDARGELLPLYVKRLNEIEQNLYDTGPTSIALPDWIE